MLTNPRKRVDTVFMAAETPEMQLLLIDDDMVSREVVSTLLALHGAVVHSAPDGPAALQLLDLGICSPALILMDARMPGLSGQELIRALRSRTQARIVLISASNPSADLCAAADSFLLKPFGAEEITRLLAEHQQLLSSHAQAGEKPENAPAMQPPDLDPEALARLRRMMPETAVREIYSALLADLDRRLEALDAALAERDFP